MMLLGKSGGGKSTLLNILDLMDTPTGGTYLLDGQDMGSISAGEKTKYAAVKSALCFRHTTLSVP